MSTLLPFQAALGPALEEASPRVREHFLQAPGTRRYRGAMRRVWRRAGWQGRLAAPLLWWGSRRGKLFLDTGADVPFELENCVTPLPDGRATMTWLRTFHFPAGTRRLSGIMRFEPVRGVIVEWLGKGRHLEVELHPRVEDGAVTLCSGRQSLRFGRLRIPISSWLAGRAQVREWEGPDGTFEVSVTISNPLLGEFFGYEGFFTPADAGDDASAARIE